MSIEIVFLENTYDMVKRKVVGGRDDSSSFVSGLRKFLRSYLADDSIATPKDGDDAQDSVLVETPEGFVVKVRRMDFKTEDSRRCQCVFPVIRENAVFRLAWSSSPLRPPRIVLATCIWITQQHGVTPYSETDQGRLKNVPVWPAE